MKMKCRYCETTWKGEASEPCPGCGKVSELYNVLNLHVGNGALPFVLNCLAKVSDEHGYTLGSDLRRIAGEL